MEHLETFANLGKRAGTIAFIGVLCAAAAMAFVYLSGADYEVRTVYLVSQEEAGTKDYYTLARSAEFMGKVLGETIMSERFIDAAIATGKMDASVLPSGGRARLDRWGDMVSVKKELDLGILTVTVRNDDERTAMRVSQAVTDVLIGKNNLFLGTGDRPVPVSVLSGPTVENNPSVKEVLATVFGGAFIGIFLAAAFVFLRYEVFRTDRGR